MSYCLNPNCNKPQNPKGNKFCQTCGSKLLLRERYRALKLIGQGGFGKTFQAVDEDKPSKPPCVIKQFYPQAQGTNNVAKAAQLFEQEAVRLDQLGKQSQIPELLARFEQDGRLYLVQEFIDGQNLAQELEQNGAFNETQIRELLSSLLPVLEFVHNQQVIHRDIKPENIIRRRDDGQLVVVDFGAAKFVTGTALLKTGTVIGSPQYTAPEQAVGKAIFASDLYSLGVTCLHLLTQVNPSQLFDPSEYQWAWRDSLTTSVSDALGQILEKMVQMATKQRYQSATEVLQDLTSSIAQSQIQSAPPAAKPPNQVQTVTKLALATARLHEQTVKPGIAGGGSRSDQLKNEFINLKMGLFREASAIVLECWRKKDSTLTYRSEEFKEIRSVLSQRVFIDGMSYFPRGKYDVNANVELIMTELISVEDFNHSQSVLQKNQQKIESILLGAKGIDYFDEALMKHIETTTTHRIIEDLHKIRNFSLSEYVLQEINKFVEVG